MAIKKDTLHPEGEPEIDIYPKTSIDQVENLQANLDALNGDIANANGEIANISTNVETIANRVEIAENSITVLITAYESYTDYTEVTNGFLLTYLSGRQIELPIKAGTNVTFSKYPGTNQIVINATGGNVPDNIALLDANNTFSGSNTFNTLTRFNTEVFLGKNPITFKNDTINMSLVFSYIGFTKIFVDTGDVYSISIPNKTGTMALTTDIPDLGNFTFSDNNMNIRGSTVISRSTGSPTEFIFGNYDNQFRSASNGLFTFYNQNAYAVINLSGKTGPQILAFKSDIPNTSTPQYNRGIDSATPTTFTYELGVYHTLTITLLTTYVSTTIILPNDYDGSSIDIELEGKSFLIMVVAGLLSVRNTTDNTEWVGKLE